MILANNENVNIHMKTMPITQNNNIPKGYRDSPLGIIPEEWEVKKLGEIGHFLKGKGVPKDKITIKGYKCLTYGDIYTKYDVVMKNIQSFIDDETALISEELIAGDILFAGSGETLEDIGKSIVYLDSEKAYAGGDIIIFRQKIMDSLLLAYILNGSVSNSQKYRMGQGHSVVHIYSSQLENLLVTVPPLPEQRGIAEILSAWDNAIDLQTRLITLLQTRKRGLMQQLLTGKKRLKGFEGEWIDHEFDDVFFVCNAKRFQINKSDYRLNGAFPIIDQGQSNIAGFTDTNDPYNELPVILFGDHTRIVKWIDYKFFPGADGTQLLKTTSLCAIKFGYYLLCHTEIPNLGYSRHMKELKNKIFSIPSLSEQTAIAAILFSADAEITLAQKKLSALKVQKKGLMQALLTGKKRVKI